MTDRWGTSSGTSETHVVNPPASTAGPVVMICPAMNLGVSAPESWQAIYRLAYEQARAALAPSKLQRMLEPSTN